MTPQTAPIFGLIFICGFVIFPAVLVRYHRLDLRHKERMAAFEKGFAIPADPQEAPVTRDVYLLRGLIWLAGGIGLMITLYFLIPILAADSASTRINHLQTLKDQGFTNSEAREAMREYDFEPYRLRGLAALGIIPSSIGIAYLAFWASNIVRPRQVKMQ